MKLSALNRVIVEGYGRTLDATYHGKQVTDPRPNVLVLGKWVNHLNNKLLCGINLNYLSEEQIMRLRTNLSSILGDRNLKRRVRSIRSLMPDIFNTAYRTYTSDAVNIIKPGTLKFFKPKDQDTAKGGEVQQPVQPMPIQSPEAIKAEPAAPAPAPAAAPTPGRIHRGSDVPAEPEAPSFTGGTAERVKSRHDNLRGDTQRKADKEVEKADDVRRGEIKGELEDKLKQEIEDNADEKIGTDDIDDAFESGEEEQDSGPKPK